ncbi:zinc-dependent metalloprotease [Taibaiella soli]|uniref:Peptidase M12B domain-containing protein n=1 Tax=Taibaiella soli TaxID=1649169 RepID=A0A2W2BF45_9BACT|nr:M12 family metallo-peptidase [Taibaiella soli]PZF74517.1 hypothetical protein DN068_02780 [Taibaiella soli]
MRIKCYLIALLGAVCSLGLTRAKAGDNVNVLSAKVHYAEAHDTYFQNISLFKADNSSIPSITKEATMLRPDQAAISQLYATKPQAVKLSLTDSAGKTYVLSLLRSNPFAEDVNAGFIDKNGRHAIGSFDQGLHYQGAIEGVEKSLATLSVGGNGEVMILFANDEGNFIVGKMEDSSGRYIFYNDRKMTMQHPGTPCATRDDVTTPGGDTKGLERTTAITICKKVQLYWEVANNLCTYKGGLANTQTYIAGLFNQVQALYANENIAVELKSFYVWTTADDYPTTTGSSAALYMFQAYWNSQNNGFDGNLAHLIERDNQGNGGVAYVNVLCNRNNAYGYSDVHGSYSAVPTFSWDVECITHETGHNFGSHHTHWCGWNTGPNNTCGAIDDCWTPESTNTCSTCPTTYTTVNSNWAGTIMSYCHLANNGIDLANGFGPLPGAVIRNSATNGSCLSSIISGTLTATPICNNNGGVTLALAANNFAVAPYTYTWSNGATTQNLTNISTPGTFSVSVKDANNCTSTISGATVAQGVTPGNGITPVENMPICCMNPSYTLTIAANAPQNISSCQTVSWLRTAAPITSISAAQAAFNSAAATDIFTATNASSINATTGATLTVMAPANCTGTTTDYYTPFVSRNTKPVNNITQTAGTAGAFSIGSTQLGSYASLTDQSSSATSCDLLDTPSVRTLSVTVTGYTGRANHMYLTVLSSTNTILYEVTGLAGNGTYTVPLSNIKGSPLQAMTVRVFDYNCVYSTGCTASTASLSATRTVTYAAVTAPKFENVCSAGSSIMVSFSPNGCTSTGINGANAAVTGTMSLFPNPGHTTMTFKFQAAKAGNGSVKIVDMVGKTVYKDNVVFSAGTNEKQLDVSSWAKGIYFLSFDAENTVGTLKMVVE